jgi:hypothetical protein
MSSGMLWCVVLCAIKSSTSAPLTVQTVQTQGEPTPSACSREISRRLELGRARAACRYWSPRHRMPFNSRNEGLKCVG